MFRGRVLRHSDGDSPYVHPDDTRTWIPDIFTWGCRMNQGKAVVDTRWREYVNRFRDTGWDYCYDVATMRNRILTHLDGDSHFVDSAGVRHWIPSGGTFVCLRNRGIPADTVRWRDYITRTPERDWAVCGDTVTTGQKLDRGQWLQSGDGRYKLHMQTDGNLVLYNVSGRAVWATNRTGQFVIVQSDGNLVSTTTRARPSGPRTRSGPARIGWSSRATATSCCTRAREQSGRRARSVADGEDADRGAAQGGFSRARRRSVSWCRRSSRRTGRGVESGQRWPVDPARPQSLTDRPISR